MLGAQRNDPFDGQGDAMAIADTQKKPKRVGAAGLAVGAIILAALAFIAFSAFSSRKPVTVDTAEGQHFSCTVLSVYDGDGPINCAEIDSAGNQVKVRLRGIEAREVDNSCRYADLCPVASGAEAKAELTRIAVGRMQCLSFGPSYNRVDASCRTATGLDVSCAMIKSGKAVRWPEYDPTGLMIPCIPRRR
ncbi:hypothetical protein Q4F19_16810 [Sphingomonas sp. BIUV-7]|uniref:Nuclease n=1 Tax=Sphingomonas natans TaxID=3063330 RepID=A0ABT8YE42_9SPHN|nr:hypothetical protein [Sphingomonas sp. BIUV-7]MDO6416053.1 hypothetical protein [Sphingomonas sp. BIUV-7]